MTALPVGAYDLTATVTGFKSYKRSGLDLAAAQVMRIDIPLEVGSQTESVTVTAEASLLKTESGDMTHNVKMEHVDRPSSPGNRNRELRHHRRAQSVQLAADASRR